MNFNWLHAILLVLLLGFLQLIITSMSQQNSGIAKRVQSVFGIR